MQVVHNSNCSKSREALTILWAGGIEPEIIDYQSQPLSKDEIAALLHKLKLPAKEILRTKDSLFATLPPIDLESEDEVLNVLVSHPALLERPILISGDRAVIGRPPERVKLLMGSCE